jgi:very-short-patch-repair endonuclease
MRGSNRSAVRLKRRLRRQSTDAEIKLWFALRDRRLDGLKFVRQVSIGPYVVDFVCREKRLVIEVDGGQHADSATDRTRDAFLMSEGHRVLRFWNTDVLKNMDGVLEAIVAEVQIRD